MQIKIASASSRDGGACVALSVHITDGKHLEKKELVLLSSQYALLLPELTGEISCELLDRLEYASLVCEAYRAGLRILNFGACSKKRMIFKLRQKGLSPDASEDAARMLVEQKYINEEQDAAREAERCLAKHWGMRRICSHLYEKGFEREAVSFACESISDFDFAASCAEHMIRHKIIPGDDPNERKKLYASYSRLGFSPSEIKEAVLIVKKSTK